MTLSMGAKTFHVDAILLAVCCSLLLLGYVMVASASLHLGEKLVNNSLHYPVRQFIHIVVGVGFAAVLAGLPLTFWQRVAPLLLLLGLALLTIVLIPGVGTKVNGSVRWLSIAGVNIQVSEIMKFISVVYMASYVTRHREHVTEKRYGLIRPLLLFFVACFLLLLEPDFGSAVVVLVLTLGVMFLAGAKLGQFLLLISVVAVSGGLLIYYSAYRLARVTGFIDPWADAQNTGFQLVQALISFGRGEIFGVGLGSGIQKLFYLPEAHTDFLFSVLAEELGLVGVVVTVVLFSLLLWRAFALGQQAEQLKHISYVTG